MKKIIIGVVVVLVVLVAGFFAFNSYIYNEKQGDASSQKINAYEACQSALAYTTFENAEQVELFMEECARGEHPEVIQRYIESLGVDGAAI